MGFIGKVPTPVPLTSSDITDGIISSAKIADGTIATADISDGAVTSAKSTGLGISNIQSFQLTANQIMSGSDDVVDTNIATNVKNTYSNVGTIVSQSSGTFSFSATGFYKVDFQAIFQTNTTPDTFSFEIQTTNDNSTYTPASQGYFEAPSSSNDWDSGFISAFVNVDNTTNVKVRFTLGSSNGASSVYLNGHATIPRTTFNFIRLGDSV